MTRRDSPSARPSTRTMGGSTPSSISGATTVPLAATTRTFSRSGPAVILSATMSDVGAAEEHRVALSTRRSGGAAAPGNVPVTFASAVAHRTSSPTSTAAASTGRKAGSRGERREKRRRSTSGRSMAGRRAPPHARTRGAGSCSHPPQSFSPPIDCPARSRSGAVGWRRRRSMADVVAAGAPPRSSRAVGSRDGHRPRGGRGRLRAWRGAVLGSSGVAWRPGRSRFSLKEVRVFMV